MSFTPVQSASSSDSNTVALTGVTAGSLIVLEAKWENGKSDISVSDGTDSLTIGTRASSSSADGTNTQIAYLLSSTSGNKTYTVTFPGTASIERIGVQEFSYTGGTLSFDTQATGTGVSGTAAATGTFSTTGTDELCVASLGLWSSTQEPISSQQIGGQAADATYTLGTSIAGYAWREAFSATQSSITAAATISGSIEWAISVAAFKITAAGGSFTPRSTLLGVG